MDSIQIESLFPTLDVKRKISNILGRKIHFHIGRTINDLAKSLIDDAHSHGSAQVEAPRIHLSRFIIEGGVDQPQSRGNLCRHCLDGSGRDTENVLGTNGIHKFEELSGSGSRVVSEVMRFIKDDHAIGVFLRIGHHQFDIFIIGNEPFCRLGISIGSSQNTDILEPKFLIGILAVILLQLQSPVVFQVIRANHINSLSFNALRESHCSQCFTLARLECQNVTSEMQLMLQLRPLLNEELLVVHELHIVDIF